MFFFSENTCLLVLDWAEQNTMDGEHELMVGIVKASRKRNCVFVSAESIAKELSMSVKKCKSLLSVHQESKHLRRRKRLFALKNDCLPATSGGWHDERGVLVKNQAQIESSFRSGSSTFLDGSCFHFKTQQLWTFPQTVQKLTWQPFDFTESSLHLFLLRQRVVCKTTICNKNMRRIGFANSLLVYHGTSLSNAKQILLDGFNPDLRKRDLYGKGDYFTTNFKRALFYGKVVVLTEIRNACRYASDILVVANTCNEIPRAILIP
jgi:hypothetical protein